jgi:hypothetical protein
VSATPQPLSLPRPLRASRTTLVAIVSAVAGALVVTLVLALLSSGGASKPAAPARYTAPGHAFSVTLPAGWSALSGKALSAVPSHPVAVLRRADRRGLVVVDAIAPVKGDARTVTAQLTKQLQRRFTGFKLTGARVVALRHGGTAFLYTFVRGGMVQSIAVATSHGQTYAVDAIVPGSAPGVARQVGQIVASFA